MAAVGVSNVTSYVQILNQQQRDLLFESPWTCQAVLRSLQPLAKQYILRMLWISSPVPAGGWGGHARVDSAHAASTSHAAAACTASHRAWVAACCAADVDGWVRDRKAHEGQHQSALASLASLGIFQEVAM